MDDNMYRHNSSDLLKSLKNVYSAYSQSDMDGKKTKQGVTRLFRRWFASFDPLSVQPVHQEFLNEVGRIVAELASILEKLQQKNPQACSGYAEEALDVMLTSKPKREKTTADWYLMISEYQCVPLLAYASAGKLHSLRNELLKRTPKRLMLPKQRELIESMESLIIKKAED